MGAWNRVAVPAPSISHEEFACCLNRVALETRGELPGARRRERKPSLELLLDAYETESLKSSNGASKSSGSRIQTPSVPARLPPLSSMPSITYPSSIPPPPPSPRTIHSARKSAGAREPGPLPSHVLEKIRSNKVQKPLKVARQLPELMPGELHGEFDMRPSELAREAEVLQLLRMFESKTVGDLQSDSKLSDFDKVLRSCFPTATPEQLVSMRATAARERLRTQRKLFTAKLEEDGKVYRFFGARGAGAVEGDVIIHDFLVAVEAACGREEAQRLRFIILNHVYPGLISMNLSELVELIVEGPKSASLVKSVDGILRAGSDFRNEGMLQRKVLFTKYALNAQRHRSGEAFTSPTHSRALASYRPSLLDLRPELTNELAVLHYKREGLTSILPNYMRAMASTMPR